MPNVENGPHGNFDTGHHALATGLILGALMRVGAQEEELISDVRPYVDSDGNYTRQIIVQVGSELYTLTIEQAYAEALKDD